MVPFLRSLFPRLTLLALVLGATGCSWLDDNDVKATVQAFSGAVYGSHWKAAAKFCSNDMAWSYFTDKKGVYTLQRDAAIHGFLNSIQSVNNRDGFYIDVTSVKVNGLTASVSCTLRIPICLNRMQLNFGKLQVPAQLKLVKHRGEWKISSIRELSSRQEG